eukprot:scaffold111140_cov72-Phaeocystis_antarctica.AAC.1
MESAFGDVEGGLKLRPWLDTAPPGCLLRSGGSLQSLQTFTWCCYRVARFVEDVDTRGWQPTEVPGGSAT